MNDYLDPKDAKIAWANGEKLEYFHNYDKKWLPIRPHLSLHIFETNRVRLRPVDATFLVTLPRSFTPTLSQQYWYLDTSRSSGYSKSTYWDNQDTRDKSVLGMWATEEDVKAVVSFLKNFKKDYTLA